MTPLITKMAGVLKEKASNWMWFDFSETWEISNEMIDHSRAIEAFKNPLPFDRCVIVIGDEKETSAVFASNIFAVRVQGRPPEEKVPVILFAALQSTDYMHIDGVPPFSCNMQEANLEEGITIHFENQRHEKDERMVEAAMNVLTTVAFWLERLNSSEVSIPSYKAEDKTNNAKRIRQGKKPLFEWTTVTIEPRSAKGESLGGSHATPRQHDVRGHWVVRNGNKFWRRPHKRGDASKGVIFHDYVVKPAVERREAC